VTVAELLVASCLTSAVLAGAFTVVRPLQAAFGAGQEQIDLQQRVRVAVETITRDLRMAASVRPYRTGTLDDDSRMGIYFQRDVITALLPAGATGRDEPASTRTYFLRTAGETVGIESGLGITQDALMRYDGRESTFPVLDDVVALGFEYFGDLGAITPSMLNDGPWPDAGASERFDADVLRIRRVRVRLRLQAPAPFRGRASAFFLHAGTATDARRLVPDQEISVDVSLRNWRAAP
jgi:hypothetical protein